MELLLKDHVMREIQEDRETSLRCYEDKPTRDIVNFCYDCIEKAINDLPQDYPRNTDEVERWIPVTEKMPEEHNSIFAKWKGTEHWSNAMFEKRSDEVLVTVEYPDGTRVTEATYTIDGKWKMIAKVLGGTVIAWKPFPEPYKEKGKK